MADPVSFFFPNSELAKAEKSSAERNTEAEARASQGIDKAISSTAAELSITYGEIELLAEHLSAHSAFILLMAGNVAKETTDGDLLESALLSPVTASVATTAILTAAGTLTVYIIQADALALITLGAVAAYQAADAGLSVAAASIGGAGTILGAFSMGIYENGEARVKMLPGALLGLGVGGYAVGVALFSAAISIDAEMTRNLVVSVAQAASDSPGNPTGFFTSLQARLEENFRISNDMLGRMWRGFLSGTETGLGNLGGAYPGLIAGLIAGGASWGIFEMTPAVVSRSSNRKESAEIRLRSSTRIYEAIFGKLPRGAKRNGLSAFDARFARDGTIRPNDVSTLFASAAQMDELGGTQEAVIRVIKSHGSDGQVRYTVQIPSTMSWDPRRGVIPNNITSGLRSLANGDQSAIAQAVYDAMEKAGIRKSDPVMLVGFSLGGIAAGAIASSSSGYNIEKIVTAGAPIAGYSLERNGNKSAALSFEANEDPVAILDGRTPQSSSNHEVIRGPYRDLRGENPQDFSLPFKSHDVLRYARMAEDYPAANNDKTVKKFLEGNIEIVDYYARGKR